MKKPLALMIFGGAAVLASAQNIVTNPGFENGLTGWTIGNDGSAFTVSNPVHSGSSSLKLTPGSSTNAADQTLGTTAGQAYTFSFWLDHDGGDSTSNLVAIDWDGTQIPGSPTFLAPATGWVQYTYDVTASSSNTAISILAHDPVGNIFLDDVSVTPNSVPEPFTLAGLAAAAAFVARRRRASLRPAGSK